jgi:hypothetical protein
MSAPAKNSQLSADDGYCEEHNLFYEFQCPECISPHKHCNTCNYCGTDFCSTTTVTMLEGSTIDVCSNCIGAVEHLSEPQVKNKPKLSYTSSRQAKPCKCEYDGETSIYCSNHDIYYCSNCTGGRGECPICELYDKAVGKKNELDHCVHTLTAEPTYCDEHYVWYCHGCYEDCPRCLVDRRETFSLKNEALLPVKVVINPSNYPLIRCADHGWYCSRCDKNCSSCNNRSRWKMNKCLHDTAYCPRCGLGCSKCGKQPLLASDVKKKHMMKCHDCGKKTRHHCDEHDSYYCTDCDGKCIWCEGSYATNGTVHHKCKKKMTYCMTHKKHFCTSCGQKCKLCVMQINHRCGEAMNVCKVHDVTYCPKCSVDCDSCKKEMEVAKSHMAHHCGCSTLFCAKHQLYFCPACDFLCNCAINCGIVEKYGSKEDENKYSNVSEDMEWQWAEFQTWSKERGSLLKDLKDFSATWHELMNFLHPKLMLCINDKFAEETSEKLFAVDSCFKAFCKTASLIGVKNEEEEDDDDDIDTCFEVDAALDRAYGGNASYKDSDGKVHYFHKCDENNAPRVKYYIKAVITYEGGDLLKNARVTNFQAIVLDVKK